MKKEVSPAAKKRRKSDQKWKTAKNAPSDQQVHLTGLAIKMAADAQESTKTMALELKAKREKRKRALDDKTSEGPAPKKAKQDIPEDLRTTILSIIAETKVKDNYTNTNTTSYPQIQSPPPAPKTANPKEEGAEEEVKAVEGVVQDEDKKNTLEHTKRKDTLN